jgi:hypothetical protein
MIHRLIAIQQQLGLSDIKFAKKLHMNRATWQALRTGKIKPGHKSIVTILRVYPELAMFIADASQDALNEGSHANN